MDDADKPKPRRISWRNWGGFAALVLAIALFCILPDAFVGLVQALAWPGVVAIAILAFRRELGKLIDSLAEWTSFKYKGAEFQRKERDLKHVTLEGLEETDELMHQPRMD